MGSQRGLAVHRYELTVRQAVVVDFLLRRLSLSAGNGCYEFEVVQVFYEMPQ